MKTLLLPLALSVLLVCGIASAKPDYGHRPPSPRPAPELSVTGAGSALALLAGAALIVAGRRRKKSDS